jgi:Arc/MetJ-type ribon-helix-helix transcriptional regulator
MTSDATRASPTYAEKLSISMPRTLLDFVERYRVDNGIRSRSEVIERALLVLRERELETAYRDASRETDPAWEATVADGLDDAAW